ncbi:MAG: LysR family transcriptional regulator [Idiomarinaceae bacterium HL-53]|nr:MAG: LysR family transcriptional regulator [Idiomarinaceae bacterium HL-53]CUS49036.1 LysR family transcriptional regulator, glycine cleavage system transcriptional activator [Idiomarinaceae bacterium HL-53]
MTAKFPSLNALRVFETVSRTKSLKRAAAQLGVTQSAISRQLSTLEQQLGAKLIQRDNKVHALTPAGEALAPELTRIFRQLERIVTHAMREGEQLQRQINVAISHEVYQFWLMPALPEFQQLYPQIELNFVQAAEYIDRQNEELELQRLLRNEVDILVAFGNAQLKTLVASALCRPKYALLQASVGESDLVHIAHQILPTSLFRETGVTAPKQNVARSTLMGGMIAQQQNQALLVPAIYQPQVTRLAHEKAQVDMEQPLTAWIRKADEREFGMVAFLQWLEHRGRKTS